MPILNMVDDDTSNDRSLMPRGSKMIHVLVLFFLLWSASCPSARAFSSRRTTAKSSVIEWASVQGVTFAPGVSIRKGKFGWGVRVDPGVTKELGETVLKVPRNLVWNAQAIHDDLNQSSSEKLEQALETVESRGFGKYKAEFLLFIKIILERTNVSNEEQTWKPWMEAMPSTFETGLCMTVEERNCLPAFCHALAENESIKFQVFSEASKFVTPVDCDEELLKWAYNIVYSRSWRQAPDDADDDYDNVDSSNPTVIIEALNDNLNVDMVPMGDMFNHGDPANVVVSDQPESSTIDFRLTEPVTGSATELCLSYGLSSSLDRFLILFGFVDQNSECCYSEIAFTDPSPELVALGCQDRSQMIVRCDDGAASNTVYDCMLYAILETQQGEQMIKEKQAFYQAHVDGDAATKAEFHKRYGRPVAAVLGKHFKGKLTELEDLWGRISKTPSSDRLDLIERHNRFLTTVYSRALDRLSAK